VSGHPLCLDLVLSFPVSPVLVFGLPGDSQHPAMLGQISSRVAELVQTILTEQVASVGKYVQL